MKMLKIKYLTLLALCFCPLLSAMNQPYVIERYNDQRDRAAVSQLIKQSPGELTPPNQPMDDSVALKWCASKNPDITTMVLRKDNETIGFVNYYVTNLNILWCHKMPVNTVLHLLAVDERYQRQGYGRILVEHALNDLQKYLPTTALATRKNNHNAHAFYTALGFKSLYGDKCASTDVHNTLWYYEHPACPERDARLAEQKMQLIIKAGLVSASTLLLLAAGYYMVKNYKS